MLEQEKTALVIEERIKLLKAFHRALDRWFHADYEPEGESELRSYINRNLIAARNAVSEAGTLHLITMPPPAAIGGIVHQNLDPFINLFEDFWGISIIPMLNDSIDQAIGVYEHMQSNSGLVNLTQREAIDIESAVERALRPSFRDQQPKNEKIIQDSVENILNTLGVKFTRDREVTPVGGKSFKPDFALNDLNLAIEVKLAKENHGADKIQEEINADISAYRTKWKHLIFIIYDLGVIKDPYKLRTENIRLFGISVLIVKH